MQAPASIRGFIGAPPPGQFNMARYCLAGGAAALPDKPALIVVTDPAAESFAEVWTYADVEDAVLRIAAGLLEKGLNPGDRLIVRLENRSLFPLTVFGALAAGIVALPVASGLSVREIDFLLRDSGARAIVSEKRLAGSVHQPSIALPRNVLDLAATDIEAMREGPRRANWAATTAEDPAFLIYTSGTTARPKGVLHAHRSAWGRRPMYKGWYDLSRADRVLHAGAFNWTYTLGTGLTDPWANAATAIIYTGERRPGLWPALINRSEATIFAAVPGLFRQILKYAPAGPIRLPTLRHGLVAGETPPEGLFEAWQERTGTELHEALGMSEISTYISTAPGIARRPGAIGRPQPGRSIAILSDGGGDDPLPPGKDGLIAVHRSDPGLMLGYWNRPEEEAEVYRGQWFVGGDIGRMDADGYVTHLGRANDIMKALGYRVAPQEVEAVLAAHPQVADVACAEIRVRDDVSVIGAFVVPANPERPPSPAELLRFAETRLAPYKVPREVRFVKALPRTANGKVVRSALARSGSPVRNPKPPT